MKRARKNILFVIPYHKIGGAEKVHLEIIKSLPNKPIVYFPNIDRISEDNPFKKVAYCFCKTSSFRLLIGYFTFIAAFQKSYVFGCNSKLFYEILPSLGRNIVRIDLTHAFSTPDVGMEHYSLKYVDYLDKRIVINNRTLYDYRELYNCHNINEHFLNRFELIPNGVEINGLEKHLIKSRFDNFIVGYVGRNSPEKRPELFFKIVKEAVVRSKVLGDDFRNFKQENQSTIFFENCNDPHLIRNQFTDISVLIVTSDKEGFPLVIMEAMELGIPIISTDVGSVKEHVKNNVNGFLIPVDFDVSSVVDIIREISNSFILYNQISVASREHAVEYFDITNFRKRYQKLFE